MRLYIAIYRYLLDERNLYVTYVFFYYSVDVFYKLKETDMFSGNYVRVLCKCVVTYKIGHL